MKWVFPSCFLCMCLRKATWWSFVYVNACFLACSLDSHVKNLDIYSVVQRWNRSDSWLVSHDCHKTKRCQHLHHLSSCSFWHSTLSRLNLYPFASPNIELMLFMLCMTGTQRPKRSLFIIARLEKNFEETFKEMGKFSHGVSRWIFNQKLSNLQAKHDFAKIIVSVLLEFIVF